MVHYVKKNIYIYVLEKADDVQNMHAEVPIGLNLKTILGIGIPFLESAVKYVPNAPSTLERR